MSTERRERPTTANAISDIEKKNKQVNGQRTLLSQIKNRKEVPVPVLISRNNSLRRLSEQNVLRENR